MRLDPIMTQVDASVEAQLRMADPALVEAARVFMEVFRPTVRTALLDVAQHAAAEVSAQLGDQRVTVRLSEGDPELVVERADTRADGPDTDDRMEARITLRLPEALKGIIEDAASSSGDSVNSWVVEALRSNARRRTTGARVDETFEL